MFYIWVRYDRTGDFQPHMTFKKSERECADFEIRDLKDHGHQAKYGEKFP
jgi:hypothetical protein